MISEIYFSSPFPTALLVELFIFLFLTSVSLHCSKMSSSTVDTHQMLVILITHVAIYLCTFCSKVEYACSVCSFMNWPLYFVVCLIKDLANGFVVVNACFFCELDICTIIDRFPCFSKTTLIIYTVKGISNFLIKTFPYFPYQLQLLATVWFSINPGNFVIFVFLTNLPSKREMKNVYVTLPSRGSKEKEKLTSISGVSLCNCLQGIQCMKYWSHQFFCLLQASEIPYQKHRCAWFLGIEVPISENKLY